MASIVGDTGEPGELWMLLALEASRTVDAAGDGNVKPSDPPSRPVDAGNNDACEPRISNSIKSSARFLQMSSSAQAIDQPCKLAIIDARRSSPMLVGKKMS